MMADFLIVVNGIPGAGKTTLAGALERQLGATLVAKDAIKEALAEAVDARLPTSRLGAIASENLWDIAGMLTGTVLVESFWATGRDEGHFRRGFERLGSPPAVELWCHAPLEIARHRFLTRERHSAHSDGERLAEWEALSRAAAPMTGLPVIRVETGAPVDAAALAGELQRALPGWSAHWSVVDHTVDPVAPG